MRHILPSLFLCLLAIPMTLHAGKDPAEEVIVKMLGVLEKMAETLSSVKDEDSVAAAKEPLKKHVLAFKELRAQAEKLPPPSREVKDRLAKEYKKKLSDVQEKVMTEIVRVRSTVPMGRDAIADVSALLRGEEVKTKAGKDPEKKEEK